MAHFQAKSVSAQVAAHLKDEVAQGEWSETMPGEERLMRRLGVGAATVREALKLLEKEGVLAGQGAGRRRKIVLPENHAPPALRVGLLHFDPPARSLDYMIELHHRLEDAGQTSLDPDKTLIELGMNVSRVARYVKKIEADAWIVCSASREVLEWFAAQEMPAFALFGRMAGVPLAGAKPDKVSTHAAVARCLLDHGHRRISFLCRHQHRLPEPGRAMRAFLGELEADGIVTGAFNTPDWEENPEGFERLIESLFGGPTPPTALILDEPILYHAAHHYLARRGLQVPAEVSLTCTDGDPDFAWCKPSVAHIQWDSRPLLRRIMRWVNNVNLGKDDRKQSLTKAEFVEGGTIGPAAK